MENQKYVVSNTLELNWCIPLSNLTMNDNSICIHIKLTKMNERIGEYEIP
jgi:hypothetical protein